MRRSWQWLVTAVLVLGLAIASAQSKQQKQSQQKNASQSQKKPSDQQKKSSDQKADSKNQDKQPSKLHIDSGELLSSSGMPIHVSRFDAVVGGDQKPGPRDGGKKPVVTIRDGTAFLSRDAITKLLNSHLNSGNVKDLSVTTEPEKVTIKGKAHKVVDVPFQLDGKVMATPDGLIKLQVGDEKAAHLPESITKALGFDDLSKMIGNDAGKGIQANKNSVTFDPDLMWGLPIHGRVVRAATNAKGLMLTFGPDGGKSGAASAK